MSSGGYANRLSEYENKVRFFLSSGVRGCDAMPVLSWKGGDGTVSLIPSITKLNSLFHIRIPYIHHNLDRSSLLTTKNKPKKGVCGLPESVESERTLNNKLAKLVDLVKESNHIVVLTGAGVSTSAGIPDFRGPKGIWTEEERTKKAKKGGRKKRKGKGKAKKRRGEKDTTGAKEEDAASASAAADGSACANGEGAKDGEEKVSVFYNSPSRSASKRKRSEDGNGGDTGDTDVNRVGSNSEAAPAAATVPSFESAKPTFTHRAITKLASLDIIKYCVTQNVDGLHRRSGLPRSKHAVLHGCVFTEKCEKCGEEYFHDRDLGGVSFKKTGRQCTEPGCGGDLRDTILDWDDALPEDDWERSQDEAEAADLIITLGTSLRIEPAGSLPLRAKKFVVVNLQVTPLDDDATLIIRERVDRVMGHLLSELNISLDD
eukprot:CAMPEP_0178685162 /NCGR_PEP_ID=MMETSP0699-20121125/3231_1 /TAXON_ID=265572 /ORGANISM="Extubocellulus spinifer, Strain CCMP396" /LENGTH=430 /DNA_ID=CAMNT_0020329887 /DNA_START=45 /DNA_END=1337 /DNA_ORIENTATION=-